MENKAHALAAGAFVLAVLALLIGMAMWLMRDVANTTTYELVSTEAVTGLQPQAAVRYKGVAVGKVTSIGLDPGQRGNVLIRIAVSPSAPISRSTFATLGFQGVTGLSFLQLDDEGTSTEPLPPGPNGPPRIPFKSGLLGELTERAQALIGKLDETADRVNRLLGDDNQAAISTALVEIGRSAQSVKQLAATTQQTITAQFGPGQTDIPGLVRQANTALKSIDGAAQQTRQTVARFDGVATDVKRAVDQVAGKGGVVDQLSESASTVTGTTLPRIQTLTEDASRTIRRLDRVANTLGENPQSLIYGTGTIPPGPGEPGFGQAGGGAAPDTPVQPVSR
ncbi:MlaD family protein [Ottowia sp.]|uniref:MlaD family protein n=1 Tax=Ottowia sp. TaxID=1898956 RepID=UPI002C4C6388|nr:MlaD family protein [Ottowia sp.]HOB66937.1 MlaD family protein [Ottowia sp.]HPZ58578.1 MlaD family protein [Ottowia sp.]HQD47929.1 MlaD family protein [Ottowia sp.]